MISQISSALHLDEKQVKEVLDLLNADATIPFIARYRKELTGGLDEVQITDIRDLHQQIKSFQQRKESIIKSLEEQGLLSDERLNELNKISDKAELEDFYLPFKPKRKTKGSVAKENGLEGLAKMMMSQNHSDIEDAARRFTNTNVKDVDTALQGARDIVAEWVNENIWVRKKLRQLFWREGLLISKIIKGKEIAGQRFQMYFEHQESIKRAPAHRVLAMFRGENEGYLRLKTQPSEEQALLLLNNQMIKSQSTCSNHIALACKDAYKRLLQPSLQTEITKELKEKSDIDSILIFSKNLKELLLAPPLKNKRVMAIDPGFRTGCKIVCLNENGDLLHNETIYPHAPQRETNQGMHKLRSLASAYKTDVIAIGNGTAGKETDMFVKKTRFDKPLKAMMVSESGASVYSASSIAREEFPNYDITVRGSVSIGRRLIDPLSELVKIDPKSIGVGQYQHDVDQNKLSKKLDETVMTCVNMVGVDLNTAGKQLLSYVSGIGPSIAENIIAYRKENGDFTNRKQLLKVKRLGPKVYEQAAGFLRITEGNNVLDNSSVHPESYSIIEKMAADLGINLSELIANNKAIGKISLRNYISNSVGLPTLEDIKKELLKPGLDPRSEFDEWEFDPTINRPEDLYPSMKLKGIVTNITAFGAFVDVGIHQDGLVHKSNITNDFVSDPNAHLHIGQHVWVSVISVDLARKRIQFSMKGLN